MLMIPCGILVPEPSQSVRGGQFVCQDPLDMITKTLQDQAWIAFHRLSPKEGNRGQKFTARDALELPESVRYAGS